MDNKTKEVKTAEVKADIKEERFLLSEKTRERGYTHKNPVKGIDIRIDFERDKRGNETSMYASTGTIQNGTFISDNLEYITGLTGELVYILATAGVIKLKKKQYHFYTDYLKTIERIEVDD